MNRFEYMPYSEHLLDITVRYGSTGITHMSTQWKRCLQDWADAHPQYRDKTWDFNFDDSKHKDGSYYYFTRCPLNDFARKYGFLEVSELSLSGYEVDAPSQKMRS